jgi:hypothetical protein
MVPKVLLHRRGRVGSHRRILLLSSWILTHCLSGRSPLLLRRSLAGRGFVFFSIFCLNQFQVALVILRADGHT